MLNGVLSTRTHGLLALTLYEEMCAGTRIGGEIFQVLQEHEVPAHPKNPCCVLGVGNILIFLFEMTSGRAVIASEWRA